MNPTRCDLPDLLRPAPDPVREALESLLDPLRLHSLLNRAWRAWSPVPDAVQTVEVRRVHYRPFVAARMVLELGVRSVDPTAAPLRQYLYVQVYPDAETALHRRAVYLRKPVLPSAGPPVFLIEEVAAVAFSLPNGPRLRKLATFLDPELFRRLLRLKKLDAYAEAYHSGMLELVRYVPRKRVLLRLPGSGSSRPGIYIKAFSPEDFPLALRRHLRMLAAAEGGRIGFRVPPLVAKSAKRRALFLGELPGERFTAFLARDAAAVVERVGAAVASLHRAPLSLAGREWSAASEFAAMCQGNQDLCAALPGLAPELEALAAELEQGLAQASSFPAAPIHANLFGDQILVAEDTVGIVDWDDLALGDPCFDLGRLLAHMAYAEGCQPLGSGTMVAEVRHLRRGYRASGGPELPVERLAWHFAAALILRAKISALRPLLPGWPAAVAGAARLARQVLNRGLGAWWGA